MSEPIRYSAGTVTAYGAAVRGGYTGTYEEWCRDMANLGDNVAEVREKAAQAAQSASDAAGSATAAAGSAGSAAGSASAAAASAAAASDSADSAASSVTAASGSATAAANSATAAAASATAAEAAQTAAVAAKTATESARDTAISTLQTEGAAQKTAIQQKGAEVIASIPSDYTDLTEDVSDLKSAFNYYSVRGNFRGNMLTGIYNIEKGTLSTTSGGTSASEIRARTANYIQNSYAGILFPADAYKISIYGYSAKNTSGYIGATDWINTGSSMFMIVDPAWNYFKLVISRIDNANISSTDLNTISSNLTFIKAETDTQFIYEDRPADGKAVGDLADVVVNRNNILSYGIKVVGAYYDGYEVANESYLYFIVPVIYGKTYVFGTPVRFLSTENERIGLNYAVGSTYTATYTGNIYITFSVDYESNLLVYENTVNKKDVLKYGDNGYNPETFEKSVNTYLDKKSNNILKYAILEENYYYNGYNQASQDYSYFIVPVTSGVTYVFGTACRFVASKDSGIVQNVLAGGTFTATYTGALYVTFYNDDRNGWMMYESDINFIDVPAYNESEKIQETVHDTLKGKVWYACGDSFTDGDYTGYSGTYRFADQPYMGKKMVYPFFVGRRTGCIVKNLASSGSTLAVVSGSTNNFINIYQNIGPDANYITIKYGINDGHRSVPIGEIDSTNDSTFYGAWNTVLSWLIANRPDAKIGIIVSNGLDSDSYAEATIAIAKKYGLPYLNEWNGEQVPVLLRSGRADVDADIIQARTDYWKVSNDNWHPNIKCHEYESTFVEDFLKRL